MRRLALVLVLLVLSGCGSTPAPPKPQSPEERFWAAQALVMLDGLDDALRRITAAGVGPRTLTNDSLLYSALVGYSDIGDCGNQLRHLGRPSARELEVGNELNRACAHFQHAAELFTRAVTSNRSSPLVAAASEALAMTPILRSARALLTPVARRPASRPAATG